jgi:formimidoylglutamate deiminase
MLRGRCMRNAQKTYFAPCAWVQGGWQKDVLLSVASDGTWSGIEPNALDKKQDAIDLKSPVLPGLVNAHSHAFQRAIAGMTERPSSGQDNFWSWRDRMYKAAQSITPEQLESIAALLYAELLQSGYTQVCEFQYLHNDQNGQPYANPLEMSLALVRAAQRVGIGITLLPTLYMRSGFSANSLRDDQQRFASSPDSIFTIIDGIDQKFDTNLVNTGLALHSLRAVGPAALNEAVVQANARKKPIHIHIAEQTGEVEDCIKVLGQRPVAWLLNHVALDAHWNLVHATHASASELQAVKGSGASIVLCPSTEANLGDGIFDLSSYAKVQGNWSVGSDSHVTRSWQEELRLLEYSQRLHLRRRNVFSGSDDSAGTAAALFNSALSAGAAACGLQTGGLAVGHRADFVVLDTSSPALLGVPSDYLLDAMIFSSPEAKFSQVFVAGQRIVQAGRVENWQSLVDDFTQAMQRLWI